MKRLWLSFQRKSFLLTFWPLNFLLAHWTNIIFSSRKVVIGFEPNSSFWNILKTKNLNVKDLKSNNNLQILKSQRPYVQFCSMTPSSIWPLNDVVWKPSSTRKQHLIEKTLPPHSTKKSQNSLPLGFVVRWSQLRCFLLSHGYASGFRRFPNSHISRRR